MRAFGLITLFCAVFLATIAWAILPLIGDESLYSFGVTGAYAQEAPRATNPPPATNAEVTPPANPPPSAAGPPQASDGKIFYTTKHPWEIYLSGITIALLVFMSGLLVAFSWRTGFTSDFQKTFLLLTVVFAALFLIVAGYSDDQTAPVFSLLGAIVGYLFGRPPSESTTVIVPPGPVTPPAPDGVTPAPPGPPSPAPVAGGGHPL